ncbi:ribosomal-protein-L7/L12-serine acetyltransferase [Hartmannibacter diazotrophicus]|uniref:Ribosomal-protein-L7/L12-serine acetyltransferase n=1 Tax=Hartmannibacter diazotrophicus TaxID=1482074 RepID=A0A2C9DB82_9HYPH|nr:GNAT family N-acetyltransferase [Hartmannibacter diazotrophicus]SON57584.1 ribosomal-protein-L7/L12-serine acetyltransferase [Hartmannibacter diazotrophicus]
MIEEEDSTGTRSLSDRAPSRPVLETGRLIIRAPVLADAPALASLADNRKIAQNLTRMPYPYGLADAEAFIAEAAPADGLKHLIFAKRPRHLPEMIGAISLDHRRGPVPELGYWIGEEFWNRGYATEAAQAAVDFGFSLARHARISVSCRVTNAASRRVIEKCGFQYTGQDLSPSVYFASVVAIDRFTLDRRTWESLRRWLPVSIVEGDMEDGEDPATMPLARSRPNALNRV